VSEQEVRPFAAGEHLRVRVAVHRVAGVAADELLHVLDVVVLGDLPGLAHAGLVGDVERDVHGTSALGVAEHVASVAAVEVVGVHGAGLVAGFERVVAAAAAGLQRVVADAAVQLLAAVVAGQRVVARAAVQAVELAAGGGQRVIARPPSPKNVNPSALTMLFMSPAITSPDCAKPSQTAVCGSSRRHWPWARMTAPGSETLAIMSELCMIWTRLASPLSTT
jgi:hypothetical protein